MSGDISQSYDPEWGSDQNQCEVELALDSLYNKISEIIGRLPPMNILDLVKSSLRAPIQAVLSEKEWRLIRFSVERARNSL